MAGVVCSRCGFSVVHKPYMIKDGETYCIPCYTIVGGGINMSGVKCNSCGMDVTKKPYVGKGGKVYCVPCYQAVGGNVAAISVRVPSYVQSLKNPMSKRALKSMKKAGKLHPFFGQVRGQYLSPEELAMRRQLGPMEQNPSAVEWGKRRGRIVVEQYLGTVVPDRVINIIANDDFNDMQREFNFSESQQVSYIREFVKAFIEKLGAYNEYKKGQTEQNPKPWPSAVDFSYASGTTRYNSTTEQYKILNAMPQRTWQRYLDAMAATGVTVEFDAPNGEFVVTGQICDSNPHSARFNKYMSERHTEQAVGDIRAGIITKNEWIKQLMSDYGLSKDEAEKLTEFKMKGSEENPITVLQVENKIHSLLADVNHFVYVGDRDTARATFHCIEGLLSTLKEDERKKMGIQNELDFWVRNLFPSGGNLGIAEQAEQNPIRDQVPGAQYKSFMTTTEDVKAMVKALEEAIIKVEKDFDDALTVRAINSKGYCVFWAIGKGGDVWIVRHMEGLFSGVRDEQNPNKVTWKCPHCGSMGLRPFKVEFKEPGHKIIQSICEDCGKESVQEITPTGVEQNPAKIDHAGAMIDYHNQTTRVILDYKQKKATIYHILDDNSEVFDWAGTINEFKQRNTFLFNEIMKTATEQNPLMTSRIEGMPRACPICKIRYGAFLGAYRWRCTDGHEFSEREGIIIEQNPKSYLKLYEEISGFIYNAKDELGKENLDKAHIYFRLAQGLRSSFSKKDNMEFEGSQGYDDFVWVRKRLWELTPQHFSDKEAEQNPQPTIWHAGNELKFYRTYDETKDPNWDRDAQDTIDQFRMKGGAAAVIHSGNLHHLYAIDKVESNPALVTEQNPVDYYTVERELVELISQSSCSYEVGNKIRAKSMIDRAWGLWSALTVFEQTKFEKEHPGPFKYMFEFEISGQRSEENPRTVTAIERDIVGHMKIAVSSKGQNRSFYSILAAGLYDSLTKEEKTEFYNSHPAVTALLDSHCTTWSKREVLDAGKELRISEQWVHVPHRSEENPPYGYPRKHRFHGALQHPMPTQTRNRRKLWCMKCNRLVLAKRSHGPGFPIWACPDCGKQVTPHGGPKEENPKSVHPSDYNIKLRVEALEWAQKCGLGPDAIGTTPNEWWYFIAGCESQVKSENNPRVGKKRRRELLKKIPQIKQGLGTRPPKEWWEGMSKIVKKGYPGRSKQAQSRITAGVWHHYPPEAKIGIIKRLAGGVGGIPSEMNPTKRGAGKVYEMDERISRLTERYEKCRMQGKPYKQLQKKIKKLNIQRSKMSRESNPYTSTGLYYPTKGSKEARQRMAKLRAMRSEGNPQNKKWKRLRLYSGMTHHDAKAIAEMVRKEGKNIMTREVAPWIHGFYIPKRADKRAALRKLRTVGKKWGYKLNPPIIQETEQNALASAEVLSELARRRQAESLTPEVVISTRRTVYWIAGGDDANTELRKKIIKENLEKKYGATIEIVKSPGQKIWGRQGRRPSGWEFIAVG